MKVSVICAPEHGRNPGMATVNRAFLSLCRQHKLGSPTFFQLRSERYQPDYDDGVEYIDLYEHFDSAASGDRIVFWGDFLHMRSYQETMAASIAQTRGLSLEAVRSRVRCCLLGSELLDDDLSRVVGYGGTLLLNGSRDFGDTAYRTDLSRLTAGARYWAVRDPFSAFQVSALMEGSGSAHVCCDAALHLKGVTGGAEATALEYGSAVANRLGVFFGRSDRADLGGHLRLVRYLGHRLGFRPTWIPWLSKGSVALSRRLRPKLWKVFKERSRFAQEAHQGRADLKLQQLSECSLVVTDTYHVAVNSWRLGIPAVCVGKFVSARPSDVSSGPQFEWIDKRFTFFLPYLLGRFYVHSTELLSRQTAAHRIDDIVMAFEDPAVIAAALGRIDAHRQRSEMLLVEALRE